MWLCSRKIGVREGLSERKRKGELLGVLQLKWCINAPSLRFKVHPSPAFLLF